MRAMPHMPSPPLLVPHFPSPHFPSPHLPSASSVCPPESGFMLKGFSAALVMAVFARETVNTAPSAAVNGLTAIFFDMLFLFLWFWWRIRNLYLKTITESCS
jgi:hypothetical protein